MRSWPRDTWDQEQCQFWRKREITWREPLSNPLENLHSLITGQISSFKILRENVKCLGTSKIYWVTGGKGSPFWSFICSTVESTHLSSKSVQQSPTQSKIYMDLAELSKSFYRFASFKLENKNVVIGVGRKKSTGQRPQSQKWPNYSNIQVLRCIHMNHSSRYTSHLPHCNQCIDLLLIICS